MHNYDFKIFYFNVARCVQNKLTAMSGKYNFNE